MDIPLEVLEQTEFLREFWPESTLENRFRFEIGFSHPPNVGGGASLMKSPFSIVPVRALIVGSVVFFLNREKKRRDGLKTDLIDSGESGPIVTTGVADVGVFSPWNCLRGEFFEFCGVFVFERSKFELSGFNGGGKSF